MIRGENVDFSKELYREHLEEASFLYDQRKQLLCRPEFPWTHMAGFEERFEEHIDALLCGGDIALEVCAERLEAGDEGECHAALCVYCRLDRTELIRKALETLDAGDAKRTAAFADAFKRHWRADAGGKECMASFLEIEAMGSLAPVVIGHKRLAAFSDLLFHQHCRTKQALPALCRAIGRLRDRTLSFLMDGIQPDEDAKTAREFVPALLRLGECQGMETCLRMANEGEVWPVLWIGLAGGRSSGEDLRKLFVSGRAPAEAIEALGYLGDPAWFDPFIGELDKKTYAGPTAGALQRITGADLYETVFVPGPIDEDELDNEQLARYRAGKPAYAEGEGPGKTVRRISQNRDAWDAWISEHRKAFKSGLRYRYGKPVSPALLMDSLRTGVLTAAQRQMICDELAVRYNIDIGLEVDESVVLQQKNLDQAASHIRDAVNAFQDGEWYFNGKPV